MKFILGIALILCAPLARAEPWDIDASEVQADIESCITDADKNAKDSSICIGEFSIKCQSEDGGLATIGVSACIAKEAEAWDALLNDYYAELVTLAKDEDQLAEDDTIADDYFEKALREAQQKWVAYRDAQCQLASLRFWQGTMMQNLSSGCQLDLTAARTLEFYAVLNP